jgi:hypothetical protein
MIDVSMREREREIEYCYLPNTTSHIMRCDVKTARRTESKMEEDGG